MTSSSLSSRLSFRLDSGEIILIERRVNVRSTRLNLRWSSKENLFFLTHPPFVGTTDIGDFLTQHQWWILKTVEKIPSSITVRVGDLFSFFGDSWRLTQDPLRKKGIWKQGHDFIIGQGVSDINKTVENTLKKEAQDFFEVWSQYYAEQLGTSFARISIRDGDSRWGSCSAAGTLSYSWRLGLAPIEVAKYVCAHEVAHLKEMNHSPQFWSLVATLDPAYKKNRAWLKKEGSKLKFIYFGAQESSHS